MSRLRRNGISITEESALLGSQHPVSAHEVKVEIFTRRVERTRLALSLFSIWAGYFFALCFSSFSFSSKGGGIARRGWDGEDGIGQDGKGRLGLSMEIRWRLLYVLVCYVDICGLEVRRV